MSASTVVKKQKEREEMKKEVRKEIEKETQKESMNIENSDGTTFARVMDIIGPTHMKPVVSGGLWKGTEQITEKKSDCECDDCGQDPCIECGESHHSIKEQNDEQDPALKAKQKRADQIKKQVLLKKMQAVRQGAGENIVASYDWREDKNMRINRIFEGKKKGLWDNIHAKRKRGEKPAKPGDKDYPKTLNVEGAAWTKKAGKNKEGGLNEKGRKSYERENPGSDLKAPQPEGGSRKKSFCARMGGMKKKLTSSKTANDPDSRINKALRKWKC